MMFGLLVSPFRQFADQKNVALGEREGPRQLTPAPGLPLPLLPSGPGGVHGFPSREADADQWRLSSICRSGFSKPLAQRLAITA